MSSVHSVDGSAEGEVASYERPTVCSLRHAAQEGVHNLGHYRMLSRTSSHVTTGSASTTRSCGFAASRVRHALNAKEIPTVQEVKKTPNFVGSSAFKDKRERDLNEFFAELPGLGLTNLPHPPLRKPEPSHVWAQAGGRVQAPPPPPSSACCGPASSTIAVSSTCASVIASTGKHRRGSSSSLACSCSLCVRSHDRGKNAPKHHHERNRTSSTAMSSGTMASVQSGLTRASSLPLVGGYLVNNKGSIAAASPRARKLAAKIRHGVFAAEESAWAARKELRRLKDDPGAQMLQMEMSDMLGRWHESSNMVVHVLGELSSTLKDMEKQHVALMQTVEEKETELRLLSTEQESLRSRVFVCERLLQQLGERRDAEGVGCVTQYMVQQGDDLVNEGGDARQGDAVEGHGDHKSGHCTEDEVRGLYQAVQKGDDAVNQYFHKLGQVEGSESDRPLQQRPARPAPRLGPQDRDVGHNNRSLGQMGDPAVGSGTCVGGDGTVPDEKADLREEGSSALRRS